MAARRHARTIAVALKDMRRDWNGWSRAERFTLKLAGTATLALALILSGPHLL
jgi:hypothetical protein